MKWYVSSICTLVVISLSSSVIQAAVVSPAGSVAPPAPSVQAPATVSQYKSFREWKNAMVNVAQDRAKNSQFALSQKQRVSASADPNIALKQTPESGLSKNLAELQQQAEKDQYHLSLTKDLTISDYFVGYLTKQKDLQGAINEVSGRLTPDEIAELMSAYANNFFSSKPAAQSTPPRADSGQ